MYQCNECKHVFFWAFRRVTFDDSGTILGEPKCPKCKSDDFSPVNAQTEPDYDNQAQEAREAAEWAEQPTPYDP